jgi:hypothetical protein
MTPADRLCPADAAAKTEYEMPSLPAAFALRTCVGGTSGPSLNASLELPELCSISEAPPDPLPDPFEPLDDDDELRSIWSDPLNELVGVMVIGPK